MREQRSLRDEIARRRPHHTLRGDERRIEMRAVAVDELRLIDDLTRTIP
jgi:hypothetical protein